MIQEVSNPNPLERLETSITFDPSFRSFVGLGCNGIKSHPHIAFKIAFTVPSFRCFALVPHPIQKMFFGHGIILLGAQNRKSPKEAIAANLCGLICYGSNG